MSLKMSKIIAEQSRAHSVTIVPLAKNYFEVQIFIEGKRTPLKKVIKGIEEDIVLPTISNDAVKHLGYTSYQYLRPETDGGFYINFYKNN